MVQNISVVVILLSLLVIFLVIYNMKQLTEEHFAVLTNLDEEYSLWNPENTSKYVGPNESDETLNMWQYSPYSSLVDYKYYKKPYNKC